MHKVTLINRAFCVARLSIESWTLLSSPGGIKGLDLEGNFYTLSEIEATIGGAWDFWRERALFNLADPIDGHSIFAIDATMLRHRIIFERVAARALARDLRE
jgi:hypothetical protein